MKRLPKSMIDKLVSNHKQQDGTKEFKVVAKLFNPTGVGTWYLTELNPENNVAFGLAHVHEKELGYIDLNELTEFRGQFGLPIERDRYFEANKFTLEQCKDLI